VYTYSKIERCKTLQVPAGHGSHAVMVNVFLETTIATASLIAKIAVTNSLAVSRTQTT